MAVPVAIPFPVVVVLVQHDERARAERQPHRLLRELVRERRVLHAVAAGGRRHVAEHRGERSRSRPPRRPARPAQRSKRGRVEVEDVAHRQRRSARIHAGTQRVRTRRRQVHPDDRAGAPLGRHLGPRAGMASQVQNRVPRAHHPEAVLDLLQLQRGPRGVPELLRLPREEIRRLARPHRRPDGAPRPSGVLLVVLAFGCVRRRGPSQWRATRSPGRMKKYACNRARCAAT